MPLFDPEFSPSLFIGRIVGTIFIALVFAVLAAGAILLWLYKHHLI